MFLIHFHPRGENNCDFLYVSSSSDKSGKTPLSSSQVGILDYCHESSNCFSGSCPRYNFFLESIILFCDWKKDSFYPTSRCTWRVVMELSPHPQDIRVHLVDMRVSWQIPILIVKELLSVRLIWFVLSENVPKIIISRRFSEKSKTPEHMTEENNWCFRVHIFAFSFRRTVWWTNTTFLSPSLFYLSFSSAVVHVDLAQSELRVLSMSL